MTSTTKTPRFPAPFLVVTEMMLEPLPSIGRATSRSQGCFHYLPVRAKRTNAGGIRERKQCCSVFKRVNTLAQESVLGLSVATHCGIGVGVTLESALDSGWVDGVVGWSCFRYHFRCPAVPVSAIAVSVRCRRGWGMEWGCTWIGVGVGEPDGGGAGSPACRR